MKKNYLLFIACLVSLIWSCSEEARDYNIENKEAIEYLEKEYNVEVLSTSCIITDSLLCQIENELRVEQESLEELNLRANVVYDSLKRVSHIDSLFLMTANDSYPIRYPKLATYKNFGYHRIYVTSFWTNLTPQVSVDEETLVVTLDQWRFNYVQVFSEEIFKELTFEISAYCYTIIQGVINVGTKYRIDGEASHYQGWIWMNIKRV